jgi:mRNA interferase MazF
VAGGVERGEIRLYRFGSPDKERPVVVMTRTSTLPYLTRITVAPITSTIRGVPSEVVLGAEDGLKQACAVNLHNLATVERKLLGRRVAQLSSQRMREVCAALAFAMGCDA